MKGSVAAAAAALLTGASAHRVHRNAHEVFHKRNPEVCKPTCTTVTTTLTGEPTWVPCTAKPLPTPKVTTCPTPGTYSFPEKTVTITDATTVYAATTTVLPKGTHTIGGVTTAVTCSSVITVPYATLEKQKNGYVTTDIKTTTYTAPSAGNYTIAPITTTITCDTDTVVVYPTLTTYAPGTYTAPAVTTTVTDTSVVYYCPYSTYAASTSSAAAPTYTPATPDKGLGGNKWAMTYTPYTHEGKCKSADDVMSDLKGIKDAGFHTVRTYSTDCDALTNVGAACRAYGMKMLIGVFISSPGCDNANPDVAHQIAAIRDWAQWDLVEMAVVGNEAIYGNYCTPGQLKSLIVQVKEMLVAGGCHVPVTTADIVATWQNPEFLAEICPVVDVVGANAHPYFNADTAPADAGNFVKGQLDIIKNACGKPAYVLETGWPNSCVTNGKACCSKEDQKTAIDSIYETCGSEVIFFSYQNDPWKSPGACACEQNWGCGYLFGLPEY